MNIASERVEVANKSIAGKSRDSAPNQLGHFGLIDTENVRDLILPKPSPANELGDLLRQFGAHQRSFRITDFNVRKDILAAFYHSQLLGQIWQVRNQPGSFGAFGRSGFM